jgi:MFS family permease
MSEMRAMPGMAPDMSTAGKEPWPAMSQGWYTVVIFGFIVMTLFGNAQVMFLMVGPIKLDLKLTDTQTALIIGFMSQLVNALASLPISRFVDRYSRKFIIAAGLIIAALSNAAVGLSATAAMLLAARLIGGLGGAGNAPACYSMLGDLFPPAKLPKALSVMNIGFSTGIGLSMMLGGLLIFAVMKMPPPTLPILGELRPWQVVFLIMAIPDFVLGLLVWFTLGEPKRRGVGQPGGAPPAKAESLPLKTIAQYWWENRAAFLPMYLGLACNSVAMGAGFWSAEFYRRTFDWSPAQYGIKQGLMLVLVAPLFLLFGGWLAERFARNGRDDANLRVTYLATLAHIPFAVFYGMVGNPYLALVLLVMNTCVILMGAGPQNAALQSIVPNRMRAQITASFLLIFTLGGGFGGVLVGWITDYGFRDEAQLRYSLVVTHFVLGPLATWIFWKGMKPYGEAMARAKAWNQ